jgi:hypothetical protein
MMKMSYNKFNCIKEVYKGIKFDSQTECDYFKHLESLGYIHGETFFTQVKYVLQTSCVCNGKAIRPITYIADFVVHEKDGSINVIDIKGFLLTAVFNIKVKMMAKVHNIEVVTIGRCPLYYLAENNKEEWILMSIKKKVRKCPKKYLSQNGNKPWILLKDYKKLDKAKK